MTRDTRVWLRLAGAAPVRAVAGDDDAPLRIADGVVGAVDGFGIGSGTPGLFRLHRFRTRTRFGYIFRKLDQDPAGRFGSGRANGIARHLGDGIGMAEGTSPSCDGAVHADRIDDLVAHLCRRVDEPRRVMASVGDRSILASATPVIGFVAPDPGVPRQTAELPASRPRTSARKAAPCSHRASTISTNESRSDIMTSAFSSP